VPLKRLVTLESAMAWDIDLSSQLSALSFLVHHPVVSASSLTAMSGIETSPLC